MPKIKKEPNPAFTPCIEIYNVWFKERYPYPPTFNGREGKAMNEILAKLSESNRIVRGRYATVNELIDVFKLVLDKHDLWGYWKGKIYHLHQINDRLIEILEEIKKNNGTGKPKGLAEAAMEQYITRKTQ